MRNSIHLGLAGKSLYVGSPVTHARAAVAPLLVFLAACSAPVPATKPVETPKPASSATTAASVAPAPAAPEAKIAVVASVSEAEGVELDHGRAGSVLHRAADGSVQFAHGFFRATAPKGSTTDFVVDLQLAKAPYSQLALGTATLTWETSFWNSAFPSGNSRPLLTRWETIERVGQFATVAALEGNTWTVVAKDAAYLDVVTRGTQGLTIQMFTPRPARLCSFESPNCKMPKGKPAQFVAIDNTAPVPTLPKNFCPDGLTANARGDLYVSGSDCETNTSQLAYYAPGSMTATLSVLPSQTPNGLAVSADGRLLVVASDQLFAITPNGTQLSAPVPAKPAVPSDTEFDAVAFDAIGGAWLATHAGVGTPDGSAGGVFHRAAAPNAPWVPVVGPWSEKRAICTVIGFEVTDPSDPIFLGQNCSLTKHALENGGGGTIDILRKSSREKPQKLPSVRAQIADYEGTRPRTAVEDATKCEEKLAAVLLPVEKRADADAILKKAKKTEELEVKPARIAGKPALAVFATFDPALYAPKGANAAKKLFAPLGATLVCGVPVAAE